MATGPVAALGALPHLTEALMQTDGTDRAGKHPLTRK